MRGQDSENYNYCQDVRSVLTGELSFRSCIPVIFNLSHYCQQGTAALLNLVMFSLSCSSPPLINFKIIFIRWTF